MVFTCGMTNPTSTRYPPETGWVQVRVRISTHGYEYEYEFLPRNPFADGREIALPDPNPSRCHPYIWQWETHKQHKSTSLNKAPSKCSEPYDALR
jgi:hypothetical protein